MKEKICYFIHTEYHLLLSLNDALEKYSDFDKFEVHFVIKRTSKSNRLKQNLDLSILPYNIKILDFTIDLSSKLIPVEKKQLDDLLNFKFNIFVFFQEQDPITIILINKYKEVNTKIYLYQDGLKPYVMNGLKFTPSLLLTDIKQNRWIKRNGYAVKNHFSFITCKNYGFLKGIDKLFLTFPDAYKNWNNLPIETISLRFNEEFRNLLKKIFHWNDDLLHEKNKVIFFMNQPMHDDGSFEVSVLKKLQKKYPESKIYIKNHPLTSKVKLERYKELEEITIIDSKIPAELFISELNNSIVFSICSTSMFINDEKSKFYWINNIIEDNNVERLKKYAIVNPTRHIISVKSVDEIIF